ncbi:MAG TPA: fatty acid--CoA ligase family protein [Xanthobacteraceae bacterium]|jgi:acyl-coenzyme A synthetase/AMP-(fatty) acid ligase|nr:fatty acid--CoA ligase family protein [Xanthobacteraceae bacterium]
MARTEAPALRQCIGPAERFLFDRHTRARLLDLTDGTSLAGRLAELAGKSLLVATSSQLTTALALIELDGIARRLTILPPDIDPGHFAAIIAGADIDSVVLDRNSPTNTAFERLGRVICTADVAPARQLPAPSRITEWVMLTSGTTGVPKMVVHSVAGLTAAFSQRKIDDDVVWATFYDIRRYGGLQIFLRAVLGGTSLVLSSSGEPVVEHLERLGRHGVSHLLGTPTHWRRALMSPAIGKISPRYVRLSGEIADQAILDSLRKAFPAAVVSHAYASTEAGVAFEVRDGLAGFPAEFVERVRDGVEMKVLEGSLRIRSPRAATRYIGTGAALSDGDGFVDTGDVVELRDERYMFAGRRGGIINIGGLKVHPEEVEAVINRHPQVRMSLVRGKKNPITGAIVIADVVLNETGQKSETSDGGRDLNRVKGEILQHCRDVLPRYKVPAAISIVPALDVAATGKLVRHYG